MKENEKLWEMYQCCKRGARHKQAELLCQDRAAYKQKGKKQVIVLVDGSGKTNMNAVVGELFCEYIAEYLIEEFEHIITMIRNQEKQEAKEAILSAFKIYLYRLAEKNNQISEEYKYTVMAICIDHESGLYYGLHCGDGIMMFRRDGDLEILSTPVNGLKINETYFVTTEGAEERLNLFYGRHLETINEFVLMTDGVYQGQFRSGNLKNTVEKLYKPAEELEMQDDDGSIILLRRM